MEAGNNDPTNIKCQEKRCPKKGQKKSPWGKQLSFITAQTTNKGWTRCFQTKQEEKSGGEFGSSAHQIK